MTRVMFWNIQQFSVNKVDNPSPKRQRGSSVRGTDASAKRRQLMVNLVTEVNPDILVIVEVLGGDGNPGTLVNPNGVNALTTLAQNLGPKWLIVPPLCSGGREGVGVLYRSENLVFTGPYQWPGGGGPSVAAAGGMAAYVAPLVPPRVGTRTVPKGAAHNVDVAENTLAARAGGWTPLPVPVGAPPPLNLQPRPPYLATFAEVHGGVFVRDLSVFAIHAPANVAQATPYMVELARTQEIVGPPTSPTEVRIVAGDFNINLLQENPPANAGLIDPAYEPLRQPPGNFNLALTPTPVPAAGFPPEGQGYYATHIKGWRANFWPATSFPGYGYISKRFYAIDNIFHRGGVPNNFTIVNTITGSPLTGLPAPPGYVPPVGFLPVARRAGLPPRPAVGPPGPLPVPPWNPTIGEKTSFRGWENYGFVRSTSDHLPIAMDI